MANPLFNRFQGMVGRSNNPIVNAMQMASMFKRIQQDSSQLPKLLLDNNKINQQQYEQLMQFNGNAEQMGRYLLQNGIMSNDQLNSLQNVVPQFQELLK